MAKLSSVITSIWCKVHVHVTTRDDQLIRHDFVSISLIVSSHHIALNNFFNKWNAKPVP